MATETRLLGLRACEVVLLGGGGLTAAMEIRFGWKRLLVFVVVFDPAVILGMFSLPYAEAMDLVSFRFGRGDRGGGGKKLVNLRKGSLNLEEGANGGFFSITVFCAACFRLRDDAPEDGAEAAAKALDSCLSLAFLSSPNWFSRSRTC